MTMTTRTSLLLVIWAAFALNSLAVGGEPSRVVAPGAKLEKVSGRYEFTEGPTADSQGNVFFSDVRANRTYKWTVDGQVSVVREDTGGSNGLSFDKAGNLLACEGGRGRLVCIDPKGKTSIVADQYGGKRFNQPNDLWIDPRGGVYFSDPVYGRGERGQSGEHVYYVSPDRKRVERVVDNMVRPNGLVGTPDGKTLYVSDHGAGRIWKYNIEPDGTLSHPVSFAAVGADGMKIDGEGNVYLAQKGIVVYDRAGKHLETIVVPEEPTNLCFAGADSHTLFITARSSVFTLRMSASGIQVKDRETRP